MLNIVKHQYLAIIWALIVLILCDMPMYGDGRVRFFEGFDKLVHTGFFFVLTVLILYGEINKQLTTRFSVITIIKVFMITTFFGAIIELSQLKIFTYRSAEWWDLFADVTGIGMGLFAYIVLHRIKTK